MQKEKTVGEYIASAPKDIQKKLGELRTAIKDAAPKATEKFSYGMPFYEYGGSGYKGRLAYFAYTKNHIGLYIPPPVVENHKKELAGYKTAKATIQFPNDQQLPITLIKKLVKERVLINETAAKKK
jgi:uncharacterized protein YdhG (YjbR/CyaY superfamily)